MIVPVSVSVSCVLTPEAIVSVPVACMFLLLFDILIQVDLAATTQEAVRTTEVIVSISVLSMFLFVPQHIYTETFLTDAKIVCAALCLVPYEHEPTKYEELDSFLKGEVVRAITVLRQFIQTNELAKSVSE